MPIIRSLSTAVAASGLPLERGDSSVVGRGRSWTDHAPAAFYLKKDPVPIVQEAGCAPGAVWTGAENLAPAGIRSPDRPARS
jgi:hypothetical protein